MTSPIYWTTEERSGRISPIYVSTMSPMMFITYPGPPITSTLQSQQLITRFCTGNISSSIYLTTQLSTYVFMQCPSKITDKHTKSKMNELSRSVCTFDKYNPPTPLSEEVTMYKISQQIDPPLYLKRDSNARLIANVGQKINKHGAVLKILLHTFASVFGVSKEHLRSGHVEHGVGDVS